MTRYGPVKSGKINCNNQKMCHFNVTIIEKLMPESTIIIYHLKDCVNVFLGKTVIETENLGSNYVSLTLNLDKDSVLGLKITNSSINFTKLINF